MNCKCGNMILKGVCNTCGSEYAVEIKVTYNETKTTDNIKRYIIDNSSVTEFSKWKDYYDFDMAGPEIIQAYVKDINNHRLQVKEYLKGYTNDELIKIKNNLVSRGKFQVADEILKDINYKYTEAH